MLEYVSRPDASIPLKPRNKASRKKFLKELYREADHWAEQNPEHPTKVVVTPGNGWQDDIACYLNYDNKEEKLFELLLDFEPEEGQVDIELS